MQWFCQHEEDGSERELPLDPRLTTPDLEAKVTQYMWWVSKNCPGYNNRRKAEVMVSVRSVTHAATHRCPFSQQL
jgi:hypothetical protein